MTKKKKIKKINSALEFMRAEVLLDSPITILDEMVKTQKKINEIIDYFNDKDN